MSHPMLDKMMELVVHNFNESTTIGRAAQAEGYGLDPYKFAHPYPGSTNITNIYADMNKEKVEKETTTTTTTNGSRWRRWLPWLAALLLALALTGFCVWFWWNVFNQPPTPDPGDVGMVYEVYERDGDGPWKKSTLTVEQLLGKKLK